MKIKWQRKKDNSQTDITEYISSLTWGGSASQAARTLSISTAYSPYGNTVPDLGIKLGDRLQLYTEDGRLLIDSMVYYRERVSEAGTITYSGFDDLNYLLRSNITKNFKSKMPEEITETICNELQLSVGKLAKTGVRIKSLLPRGVSGYTVIMQAYTKAHKSNGKKYMPVMFGRKLYVIEKGETIQNFTLNDEINITGSSYSESLDSMINRVKIYDDKGNFLNEVKNSDWVSNYGIFQDNYTKEDGTNAETAAKNMLVGIDQTASVEALGNVNCISGYGVKIKDTITGLLGKFWIENDTHTWENNKHTMSLELAFKNIMDTQEDSE